MANEYDIQAYNSLGQRLDQDLGGIPTNGDDIQAIALAPEDDPTALFNSLNEEQFAQVASKLLFLTHRHAKEITAQHLAVLDLRSAEITIGNFLFVLAYYETRMPHDLLAAYVPKVDALRQSYSDRYSDYVAQKKHEMELAVAANELLQIHRERHDIIHNNRHLGPTIIATQIPQEWGTAYNSNRVMQYENALYHAPYMVAQYDALSTKLDAPLLGMWLEGLADRKPPLVVSRGQAHLTTVMPTGQGKSMAHLIPNVLAYAGSTVVIDTKGAIYEKTADILRAEGRRVIRLSAFQANSPDTYNPFDYIGKHEGYEIRAKAFVQSLIEFDTQGGNNLYWQKQADQAISAMALYVAASPEYDTCNMGGLLTWGLSNDGIKHTAETLARLCEEDSPTYGWAKRFLSVAEDWDKVGSIVSNEVFTNLEPWNNKYVQAATAKSTFNPAELIENDEPFTLFIDIPSEQAEYFKPVLRGLLASIFQSIKYAEKPEGQLPVLFMLDEFAQYGHLDIFAKAIVEARSYGVRLWTFLQGMSGLKKNYPHDWEYFISNATVIYGASGDHEFANQMSEFFGEHTYQTTYFETDYEKENTGEYMEHDAWSSQAEKDEYGNWKGGRIVMHEAHTRRVPYQRERIHHQTDDVVPIRAIQSLPYSWQIVRPVGQQPILCAKLPVFDPFFQYGKYGFDK